MAVNDSSSKIDQFAVVYTGAFTQHLERSFLVNRMALHQDALRTFNGCPAPKRTAKILIFGESPQHDVDRALPIPNVVI